LSKTLYYFFGFRTSGMDEALGQTPYSTGKLREFFELGKALPVGE